MSRIAQTLSVVMTLTVGFALTPIFGLWIWLSIALSVLWLWMLLGDDGLLQSV